MVIKVLFICLGNICRSPLAEAIFLKKVKTQQLSSTITADSVGTANYHIGESPDSRAIEIAKRHGVPMRHRGKQFKRHHNQDFDYLLAMDQSNLKKIAKEIGEPSNKLVLMREFDPHGKGEDVPDPWYGEIDQFENVYQILDRSLDEFLNHLNKTHHL